MRYLAYFLMACTLLAQSSPVFAWPIMVTYRKSTVCTSLFSALNPHRIPQTEYRDLANELSAIMKKVAPNESLPFQFKDVGAVRTHSTLKDKTLAQVARRAQGVSQSLLGASPAGQVIAAAHLQGESRLRAFPELTTSAVKQIEQMQRLAYHQQRFVAGIGHLISYVYFPLYAYVSTKADAVLLLLLLTSAMSTPTPDQAFKLMGGLGALTAMGLIGAFDCPIRFAKSCEFGLSSLNKYIDRFLKTGETWAYWSKDFTVTQGFVTDLVNSRQIGWDFIHQLNLYEQTPGPARIRYWRDSKNPWYQPAIISVDVLMNQTEAGPEMRIVMRSTALQTEKQKQTSDANTPQLASAPTR